MPPIPAAIALSACLLLLGCGTSTDPRSTEAELVVTDESESRRQRYRSIEECQEARLAIVTENARRETASKPAAAQSREEARQGVRSGHEAMTGVEISDNKMSASAVCNAVSKADR